MYAGGQNVTIDKSKLSLGSHNLTVTIITEGGQTAISEFVFESNDYLKLVCINYFWIMIQSLIFSFVAPRFILSCSVVENRIVTIHCEGINGDINESEVACIYGSGQIQEKCTWLSNIILLLLVHVLCCTFESGECSFVQLADKKLYIIM